jgi:hypothetical protein
MQWFELAGKVIRRHRAWSDETFGVRPSMGRGSDGKGPIGPLMHMKKEIDELTEKLSRTLVSDETVLDEFSDVMFLYLDSLHRAGYTCDNLNTAMFRKMQILETRSYTPGDNPDEAVEHDRRLDNAAAVCSGTDEDEDRTILFYECLACEKQFTLEQYNSARVTKHLCCVPPKK